MARAPVRGQSHVEVANRELGATWEVVGSSMPVASFWEARPGSAPPPHLTLVTKTRASSPVATMPRVPLFLTFLGCATASLFARAAFLADKLATCRFVPAVGLFDDLVWQSGSTLESLSNLMVLVGGAALTPARWEGVLNTSFDKTPVIVDNCFDDHQWWALGWIRSFEATGQTRFLDRAAAIFDYIATKGWNATVCGGGVTWCPPPTGPYKNAITTELFIASAMALHSHESLLNVSAGFYVGWAAQAWTWLENSRMLNDESLFNDGLNGATCTNNGQTTWTYNQGVLLDGLASLSRAMNNATILNVAERVARAAMGRLSIDGILVEPCAGGECGGDGQIFKGVFVRHLGALARADSALKADAGPWLDTQAQSLLSTGQCDNEGNMPFRWDGPCDVVTTATDSAALDAFTAAASLGGAGGEVDWSPLALGNCVDSNGDSAPNCWKTDIPERECRDAASIDTESIAFDFSTDCIGGTFCRVRTLGGSNACAGGWTWENGTATSVTGGNNAERTLCVVRGAAVA